MRRDDRNLRRLELHAERLVDVGGERAQPAEHRAVRVHDHSRLAGLEIGQLLARGRQGQVERIGPRLRQRRATRLRQREQGRLLGVLFEHHVQQGELAARRLDGEVDDTRRAHGRAGAGDRDGGRRLAPRPDPGAGRADNREQQQEAEQLFHARRFYSAAAVFTAEERPDGARG